MSMAQINKKVHKELKYDDTNILSTSFKNKLSAVKINEIIESKGLFLSQQDQEILHPQNEVKPYHNTFVEVENTSIINVRFVINDFKIVKAVKITSTIAIIKRDLANVLGVKEDFFNLGIDNVKVRDDLMLADLGAHPHKIFVLQLITKLEEQATLITKIQENIPSLDVITVHAREGEDSYRDIIVEIHKQCPNKEWMGGFRNKITRIEYHNAVAQTVPRRKLENSSNSSNDVPLKFHRDTQTPFKLKEMTVDTMCNQATQTYRPDLFISAADNQLISAGNYNPHIIAYKFDELVQAVTIIQKCLKNWNLNKRINKLQEYNEEIKADMRKQKIKMQDEEEKMEREIITGAVFPVNRDDFYMLYLMVGNWWKKEWNRICEFSKELKQAESNVLLFKEIQLLREIEKQRINVKKEALQKAKIRFLEQNSSPSIFTNANGEMTSIDDLPTQRAREFKEMYSEHIRTSVLPKERVQFLLAFKQLFSSDYLNFEYANDIVALINREIDMLAMGIKLKNLKGLHKRIEQLYMCFLQQKEFNPKCVKYKEPNMPKTINTLFMCSRCMKLLPVSKYTVHVRLRQLDICTSCTWLKNIGFNRVDMSPYVKLLHTLRSMEVERCCLQAVCFILQPIGMCHLTTVIWHGRSAISECSDITKLQHVRWLSDLEWSPWNTILLTNQEAKYHRNIDDVFHFYEKPFIEQVKYKHILARICFNPLLKMNHDICSSGKWSKIKDAGPYLHPSNKAIFNSVNEYDKL